MADKKVKRVVLKLGYSQYVVPAEVGTALFSALTDCEMFTEEWNKDTQSSEPKVSPVDHTAISLSVLPEEKYALGKMIYAAKQTKKGEDK